MASDILNKQKQIESLRKTARQAKTKVRDIAGSLRYYRSLDTTPHMEKLIAEYQEKLNKAEAELELAEKALAHAEMITPKAKPSPFKSILKWYSGASLTKAVDALELLDASIEQGSWLSGASRRVLAALGKTNEAKKVLGNVHGHLGTVTYDVGMAVRYGAIDRLARYTLETATRELSDDALEFFIDFKPVVDAMTRLDMTRPAPVFTAMNASRLVSEELKRQGAVSVEVCPIKYELREKKNERGEVVSFYYVAILLWPAGTKHHTSRYAGGTESNFQCHACGHAIKNMFNWVPLILTTEAGEKKSLWVGRDCAETLFGVKMDGELELAEGQR